MYRFIHAADLHLDSPLVGLDAREGAPAETIRLATREAFRNIISLCLREKAAFLVIAGDVFDGDWKDFSTGLFFLGELRRLREAGVKVFLIRGNHDSASEVTRYLPLPDHVVEFSSHAPETEVLEDIGVAIHGYSFPRRAVTEDLLPRYPRPLAGMLNIGILHTSAEGSSEHESYAPCSLGSLAAKGYQYWALGHVHRRAVLSQGPSWVVFPGNPQGRHARETGARGVTLVSVDGVEVCAVEAVAVDTARFEAVSVRLEEEDDVDALLEKARLAMAAALRGAEGRPVAARLRIEGCCAAHGDVMGRREQVLARLKDVALDLGEDLWLEKTILETGPVVPISRLREGSGLIASVLQGISSLRADPPRARALLEDALRPISRTGGQELEALLAAESPDAVSPDSVLSQVEAYLAARLQEGSGP